jgi:RimJ/RimL family protein N-acetyltransferase
MLDASKYSAIELLRDGRSVEIRALRPDDQAGLLAAIDRSSPESLRRRFFAPKRYFSEKEVAYYVNVDFKKHVALVAMVEEDGRPAIVAGGRYVCERPDAAEIAFDVIDQYQGQGIGSALLRHLAIIGRDAGLKEFTAEVLPENVSMLKVFEKSGLKVRTKRESSIMHVALQLC